MEHPAEAAHSAHCLVQPNQEVVDDLGITYNCEEDMEAVAVKEEWCDISLQLDGAVSEKDGGVSGQDGGVSGHNVSMVMPIKTELTLSDDLARLRTQHQLAEHGSVPQWEPKTEADVVVDCASTCVSPSLVMNTGDEVQAEEADTVQKCRQEFVINNGELDNQSFDMNSIIKINRFTVLNCVDKLYDIFKKPKQCVPTKDGSLVTQRVVVPCDSQRHIDTDSRDLNCEVTSQNEDIGPACQVTLSSKTDFSYELCKCAQNSYLVSHMKTHTGEKPYSCEFCTYKCTQSSHLLKHMQTHSAEKPYSCDLCEFKYAHKSSLGRHMRTHTGEKPYSCKLCKYKCAQSDSLVKHMRTHTGEKLYSCELCKYKCARSSQLVMHMRTHTGENLYTCDLCKYKCARSSSLVEHMRTHTGEKPYLCELCDYKSARRNSLVLHMRNHTGAKPYLCELCNYKSARSSSLVEHMRTHTGEKPFSCELCKYKCAQRNHLVRHMKSHTGKKPV